MNTHPSRFIARLIVAPAFCLLAGLTGCNTPGDPADPAGSISRRDPVPSVALARFDTELARPDLSDGERLELYRQRWVFVRRAVAHIGVTHRDAFYGSRAYWHTGSTRGLGWALDHPGDLNESAYVAGRGNVRVVGDANAPIEVRGDAVVHIHGDLNSTLEVKGVCEVIVAGRLTDQATLICDGQLELYVGGDSTGVLGATGGATIIIDGNAAGVIQCGAPATTLTVTGDLTAEVAAPRGKDAVLALRVDGYAPTSVMVDLATAGFARVTASLGRSNAPAGLYPADGGAASRPVARWVVLRQQDTGD